MIKSEEVPDEVGVFLGKEKALYQSYVKCCKREVVLLLLLDFSIFHGSSIVLEDELETL